MPFDPSTAQPLEFDPSTAVEDSSPSSRSKELNKQLADKWKASGPVGAGPILGAAEAFAGGIADLANQGFSALYAGAKTAKDQILSAVTGKPAVRSATTEFLDEYKNTYTGVKNKIPYYPETPEGKAILEGVGKLIEKASNVVGEYGFNFPYGPASFVELAVRGQTTKSPFGGAAGQTLVPALLLAAPMVKGKKPAEKPPLDEYKNLDAPAYERWKDPKFLEDYATEHYPETMAAMRASAVGKIAVEASANKLDVFGPVHKALDGELGDLYAGKSLTEKLYGLFDKFDPQKTIPPRQRNALIDDTVGQLDELNKIANQGKTVEQLMQDRIIRPKLTSAQLIEARTGVKPVSTKEVIKQRTADFKAALDEKSGKVIDPRNGTERDLTAGEYMQMKASAATMKADTITTAIKPQEKSLQQIVEQATGVGASVKKTSKEVKAALKEPSGVWVSNEATGQVERQLTIGEFYDRVLAGEQAKKIRPRIKTKKEIAAEAKLEADQLSTLEGEGRYMGQMSFGKSQRGSILIPDPRAAVQRNIESIKKAAEKLPTVAPSGMLTSERYNEINQVISKGLEYDPSQGVKSSWKQKADTITKRTFDISGPMKRQLEVASPLGAAAKDRFNLIKGAPAKAQAAFNKYEKDIWGGIDTQTEDVINKLTFARRTIEIDKYKGIGKVQHPGRTNAAEMEAYKNNLRAEVGNEVYNLADQRVGKYFNAYQRELNQLHDSGLLSDEGFVKMLGLEYSPREAIDLIDPETSFTFKGHKVTIRDSGIPYLSEGITGPIRMQGRVLLAESVLRSRTRIMKNEANVALGDFAKGSPENSFVREVPVKAWDERGHAKDVPKPPPGWQRIDSVVEGKQRPMFVADDFAEQWVTTPKEMSAELAQFLRVASGSTVVKALATTYNPLFPLGNLPRDIAGIWVNSGEYSGTIPRYAMQLGVDMLTVLPDAILRKGRYDKFLNEGGGMNFMTHQGQSLFREKGPLARMTDPWRNTREVLSYVNETSELWTRLALRERAIKNGKPEWQATAAAREYMEFSNGGSWVKGADTVIPYLNATTQAAYAFLKQVRRQPVRASWQLGQLLGVSTMMTTATIMANREAWEQMSVDDKVNNFIIAPKDMFLLDPEGNKRHVFFKMKLDSSLVPFHAFAVALAERSLLDKVPDGVTWAAMKGSFSQLGSIPIPIISAGATYAANYDYWKGRAVWMGPKVLPQDEVVPGFKANSTPEAYQQLGQLTGASPERTRAAVNQLIPSNGYTDLMGAGFSYWLSGMTDYQKARSTEQILAQLPGATRVIGLTHPAAAEIDQIDQAVRADNSIKGTQHDAIGGFIFREMNGEGSAKDAMRTWLPTQPPEEAEKLAKRFVTQYATEMVFRKLEVSDGIPSKTWWRQTSGASPNVRAALFYQKWSAADSENQQRMVRVAKAMQQFGVGYWNTEFENKLRAEKRRFSGVP